MYGFCLLLGLVLSTSIGERLCRKKKLDSQIFWKIVFYSSIFGLLGGRLYHVLHRADYFIFHPAEILSIWQGGLGLWGAVVGVSLGLFISTRKTNKFFAYADIFAVIAPLAQAVGRWANYFNKELFGFPTNLPWGIFIPQELRPEVYRYYARFHPLFLYESILDFLLFLFLYKAFSKNTIVGIRLSTGILSLAYLVGYSLIRFFLEFLRPGPWKFYNIPVSWLTSAVILLLAIFIWKRSKETRYQRV